MGGGGRDRRTLTVRPASARSLSVSGLTDWGVEGGGGGSEEEEGGSDRVSPLFPRLYLAAPPLPHSDSHTFGFGHLLFLRGLSVAMAIR